MPLPLEPFTAGFIIMSGAGADPSPMVPTSSLISPIFILELIQILDHSSTIFSFFKKNGGGERKDKPPTS